MNNKHPTLAELRRNLIAGVAVLAVVVLGAAIYAMVLQ
jgi:hypothetical protein